MTGDTMSFLYRWCAAAAQAKGAGQCARRID
jgi:hypothetical protein